MAFNQIYIDSIDNPTFYWENANIISLPIETAVAVAGEELSIDTADPVVYYDSTQSTLPSSIKYGTPMWIYSDYTLISKYYVKNVERIQKDQWKIYGVSVIGILDNQYHFGGVYSGKTFENVVKDIFNPQLGDPVKGRGMFYLGYASTTKHGYIDSGYPLTDKTVIEISTVNVDPYKAVLPSTAGYTRACGYLGFKGVSTSIQENTGLTYVVYSDSSQKVTNRYLKYGSTVGSELQTYELPSSAYTSTALKWCMANAGNCMYFRGTQISTTCGINSSLYNQGYNIILYDTNINSVGTGYTRGVGNVKIYDDGVLVRDLVCALNETTNTYGMYDKVEGAFHPYTGDGLNYEGWDTGTTYYPYQGETNDETIVFDDAVKNIAVYGHLPYDTKRNNLYQVLFATNTNMIKDANGNVLFTTLSNTSQGTIPQSRIYGDGTVSYGDSAAKVSVTEHTYQYDSSADTVTLFDNTSSTAAYRKLVTFDNAPIYKTSIASTGTISLIAYNENCAIVSGTGTITGKPMNHMTEIVSKSTTGNTYSTKEATVTDATLVNVLNSQNVLDRVYNYYTATTKVNTSIVKENEKCGLFYTITSPFLETVSGFLTKISANISTNVKAACEFLLGFIPVHSGNNYDNCVVLTGSGTWTVPDGVTSFRAVLVGAGNGGSSGYAGTRGTQYDPDDTSTWAGGTGGNAGTVGSAGKIYSTTVSSPEASYSYSCGTGGAGGAECTSNTTNNAGSTGGATTFGSFSSGSGAVSATGITNLLTGEIYGTAGRTGIAGAQGPQISGDTISYDNTSVTYEGTTYVTGATYFTQSASLPSGSPKVWAWGAAGGGAAAGSNGLDGTATRVTDGYILWGGYGGTGGFARARTANTVYGGGGHAGNGGGGGAPGGKAYPAISSYPYYYGYPGFAGSGGNGGAGGKGGDGCIIIYY